MLIGILMRRRAGNLQSCEPVGEVEPQLREQRCAVGGAIHGVKPGNDASQLNDETGIQLPAQQLAVISIPDHQAQ